ncbi:hypothetical protein ABPG75_014026, partial [Micractinium tetrahymenae]
MASYIPLREQVARAVKKSAAPAAGALAAAAATPPPPAHLPAAVAAPPQPQLGEQQQQQPVPPVLSPPAQPPPEQHLPLPLDSSQLPVGSQRGEGRLARLKRMQQQSSQAPLPAVSQQPAPTFSQRPLRQHRFVGGRIMYFDEEEDASTAVPATSQQPSQQQQLGLPPSLQQQAGGMPLPHQQQQQQASRQGAAAGGELAIDRGAARAAVALADDVDDFEHDPTDALRQAAGRRSGRAAGEPPRSAAFATAAADGPLADLLPGAKPKAPRKPGRRGSAGTPAGAAMRAKRKAEAEAAAAEAEEEEEGGGASKRKGRASKAGGARASRKGAAPKRLRKESPKLAESESGLGGSEGEEEQDDQLADDLLLPSPARQQPQRQQQSTRSSPAASSGEASSLQHKQQQRAPPVHRAAANAAGIGPEVELVVRVDMEGNDWPEDNPGEPYLELGVPGNINKFLRDYQRDGIRFLIRQYARGTGGILADDMGLGKTVQAISFIAALLGKTGGEEDAHLPELQPLPRIQPPSDPHADEPDDPLLDIEDDEFAPDFNVGWPILIVAPTSVLTNWEREFDMWGRFRVVTCVGGKRDSALAAILAGKKEVMIISYNTMRSLGEDLLRMPWHACIFDEAHNLKNATTATYKVANRLPTRLRYGLTGTPFQNDYTEIWTLLDLMAPGCLGSKQEFSNNIALPIMRGQKYTAKELDMQLGKEAREDVRGVLSNFVLRRTKKLIAHQLPQKMDYVVFCELSSMQLAAYRRVLESSADVQLLLHKDDPCACGSGEKSWACCGWKVDFDHGGVLWPIYHECECDNPYDELSNPKGCKNHKPEGCWRQSKFGGWKRMCPFCLVLPVCSILRKISNHLEMVRAAWEDEEGDPIKFEKDKQVAQMVIGTDADRVGGYVTTESFERLSDVATCGKMKVLKLLLRIWSGQPGTKVLLFSNSVRLLNILRAMLTSEGYDFLMLDGSTPQKDRQTLCDQFNNPLSGTFLFLISTLAGGTGLNLTAANKVIIFDPSWNPAADLQAQDRAFRIGQKKDVSVYRFVAAGTLEEMVYSRQIYKQQQSNMVLEGALQPRMYKGAKTGKKEDFGELWGMFNLLAMNARQVMTIDLLAAQRSRNRDGYRIEEYDAEELAGAVGGTGAAAHSGTGGTQRNVDDAGEAGLEALVQAEMDRELGLDAGEGEGEEPGGASQGGGGGGRHGRGRPAAEERARALLEAEQAAEQRWEGHRQETEALAQLGIAGLMQHNLALKADAGEEAKQQAARKATAA